ncbi:HNH endonuclease [Tomitella gaofuii]|uniref:HNH endonuclease n=1 Tax=Tomitella gaofuii TaxID=2760083 RepID=UPI0015FD45CA|nr:HNH endonuclease [Tomitella gaofuii]
MTPGYHCPTHARAREARAHGSTPTKVTRTWAERQRRAGVVESWRKFRGDWCPGFERPPHRSSDLTADHVTPVASGGAADGPLGVLCRSCNSRKGVRLSSARGGGYPRRR